MDEIRIEEFTEFINEINKSSAGLRNTMYHTELLLFRGHSDSCYELLPSIARNNLFTQEFAMMNEIIEKRPDLFSYEENTIYLMTKLQHYGLPTRLLDITYNALVALFFACDDEKHDGEVILFKISAEKGQYMISSYDEKATIIANMYKLNTIQGYLITKYLENLGIKDQVSINSMTEQFTSPVFLSAIELTERQKRQQGAFILFPNKLYKDILQDCISPIDKNDPIIDKILLIPKEIKKDFKKYLLNYGITKEFLFPDSVDKICESIKEKYYDKVNVPSPSSC